jgi:hypothetical protein
MKAETSTNSTKPTWAAHVKAYRTKHGVSFKEALQKAGATYTKKPPRKNKDRSTYKKNPWMVHIKVWKDAHPDWKTTMSYRDVLAECKTTYKSTKSTDAVLTVVKTEKV